jgi:hypothetical protein
VLLIFIEKNTLPFVFLLLSIACWRSLEQGYGVSWREEINILAIIWLSAWILGGNIG